MTQKELLYVEDAIGHEENIIEICNVSLEYMEDEELISFLNKEITKHEKTLNDLLNLLEDKANE